MTTVFEELSAPLIDLGAVPTRMMGRNALKVGGAIFAIEVEDALVLKLGRDTEEFAAALALPGAEVFRPGGGERRFHDWVWIPETTAEDWPRFADLALDYVARL